VILASSEGREVIMSMSDRDRVEIFHARGFFVVPGFLGQDERAALRRACDIALGSVRGGAEETGHSTPRISLLSDGGRCFQDDPAAMERITSFVGSARVCAMLHGLSRPGEEEVPRLKDAHYYHEQTKHDWEGDWHRDSQFGRPDPAAERGVVDTTTSVHFRVALEDDDRLEVVPGSHARWDTDEELRTRKGANRSQAEMPGAVRIVLRAGDACVFHAWSIHRATYQRAPVRRTVDALYAFGRPAARGWALPI